MTEPEAGQGVAGAAGSAGGGHAVFAAAGFALLIWAGTPIVTKIAVRQIDPATVGMLRTVIPALLLTPVVAVLRRRLRWPGTPRQGLLLAASALGGFVLFPLLFSLGLRSSTAAHAALILAAAPIFSGLFAAIAERRAPPGRWWLGVAVAVVGEYLLIGFRLGFADASDTLGGDVLLVMACAAAAMGYVTGARVSRLIGTWSTTILAILLAGLVLLPLLLWQGRAVDWPAIPAMGWTAVAYLALLSTILAYACWYWALGRGGIARIAASQFAQPVLSLALAVVILGEALTPPLMLAAAMILAGIFIAQRRVD